MALKDNIVKALRFTEKYAKTDMVYLAQASFWWLTGKMALFLISILTFMAFANWMSKENYGTYQFVLACLNLLTIFTLPGINTSLISSVAQKKEGTLRLSIKEKIRFGIIGSFLALAIAGWYILRGNGVLGIIFLLAAAFLPFYSTFPIFASFWNGKKRFDLQAKYQIISAFLCLLFMVPAVYFINNIIVIIAVFLASHTFFDWLMYFLTERQTINREIDAESMVFGKHLTLMSIVGTAAAQLDKIVIWKFLGAAPLAVYSFALLPIQRVQDLLPINYLSLPKLSEKPIDGERKKELIRKFIKLFALMVPLAVFLIFAAPVLYRIIFPQYMDSVVYFQAFTLLAVLSPFLLPETALVAEAKKKALYAISIIPPFLKIALFFALIPYFGIWGIVGAILIAESLRGLLSLFFFAKT